MPAQPITLYLPLSPDVEIQVTITRRTYNGIDSDPRVVTGGAEVSDLAAVARALKAIETKFSLTPTLDYPER
jgi:hypothetical protein